MWFELGTLPDFAELWETPHPPSAYTMHSTGAHTLHDSVTNLNLRSHPSLHYVETFTLLVVRRGNTKRQILKDSHEAVAVEKKKKSMVEFGSHKHDATRSGKSILCG